MKGISKEEIRKEIIRRLRDQDLTLREERSLKIQEKLLSSEEFKVAKTVMTYVSLPTEVSTDHFNREALKRGKRVAVPYIGPEKNCMVAAELTLAGRLEKGPLGISQPEEGYDRVIPLKEIDLIVVPGIAYDANNMRLGRGRGCYDRFLAAEDLSSKTAIGVAFHFQMVGTIPPDPQDRPVTRVITD
ncbi:MAG: 5-formyltetrahydrofolate cyclo-ligase [Candidatus Omnitrophota bacterium]